MLYKTAACCLSSGSLLLRFEDEYAKGGEKGRGKHYGKDYDFYIGGLMVFMTLNGYGKGGKEVSAGKVTRTL